MRERYPETWSSVGTVMSNADHSINYDVKKLLDKGKCIATYPGWDFYSYVWKHSKGYSCEVWTYKEYNKTIHNLTLDGIMNDVSEEFGHE